ncbi:MAG: prepilin-type N-terminal cleavage/methylation domain-containing protein [Verrucomicrobiota bacterium]|jgi:prepilin-type N-terminal cleavage/methylation domain-containing protein
MKLQVPFSGSGRGRLPDKGFTLPEILIATTVFLLMVGGIIAANLFGLRMFQITETKLNAIRWSRETVGKITAEVRACDSVQVGNVTTNNVFEGLLDGETQQGNSLLIYPTTDTNNFIVYSVNSSDETFSQTVATPSGTNTVILADSVTNTIAFTAQNFSGNVLTNIENNRLIHLTLEFYQPARFMQGADYYKMETSMTRRALQ